jgi:poly-gamma-glutamate synthesis protein (capsule biosynthesis protein)
VALVPVVGFWSGRRSIESAELAGLLAGTAANPAYSKVEIAAGDSEALASKLGTTLGSKVIQASATEIKAAVRASAATIGVIRAEDLTPDVRALAVGGVSLFGSGRVKSLASWPLLVPAAVSSTFEPGKVWDLASGGDVNLERSVYTYAVQRKLGADYTWNGGYASIRSRVCCGYGHNLLAVARRTGNPGAFRNLLSGADLTLVNLEGPAPNHWAYHPGGLVFTMDPALLSGLAGAGIDGVSMANNHLRNGGNKGVLDTIANLDKAGIAHAGAGGNVTAAIRPAWFAAGGLRVAFLAFDAVAPTNFATSKRPGAAPYSLANAVKAIKAARASGADFVVVMPHWGTEYTTRVSSQQRRDAAAMVAAGADLILASHSHVTGPIEAISRPNGGPAFIDYSLGDLVFDLNYSEATQEGVVVDLTYIGRTLVQVSLDPTIMVDRSQPNLLDPAADGRAVLDRIRSASKAWLRW